jgi:hypothetical protein
VFGDFPSSHVWWHRRVSFMVIFGKISPWLYSSHLQDSWLFT